MVFLPTAPAATAGCFYLVASNDLPRSSSGSLAMFAAIRRASSLVSILAADRRTALADFAFLEDDHGRNGAIRNCSLLDGDGHRDRPSRFGRLCLLHRDRQRCVAQRRAHRRFCQPNLADRPRNLIRARWPSMILHSASLDLRASEAK
jgi:hypothetical protein